jgi:hypothetical protein
MVKRIIDRVCAVCGGDLGPGYHRPGAKCWPHAQQAVMENIHQMAAKQGPAYRQWVERTLAKSGRYRTFLENELVRLDREGVDANAPAVTAARRSTVGATTFYVPDLQRRIRELEAEIIALDKEESSDTEDS